MTACLNCGSCCHFIDEKGKFRKCRYLVRVSTEKTVCRIYHNRLGTTIYTQKESGNKVKCCMREYVKINYPGCPFNQLGQKEFRKGHIYTV